jgi:hypothetical protein
LRSSDLDTVSLAHTAGCRATTRTSKRVPGMALSRHPRRRSNLCGACAGS